MTRGTLAGLQRGLNRGQNGLKLAFFEVFSSPHSEKRSVMAENEVKLCQWHGLLLRAILVESEKPHGVTDLLGAQQRGQNWANIGFF